MQTKADLIAGGLLYIFYSQHSCKYISTPFIRSLPSLLSGQIMISNDSKILLNPPLKRGHSYFKESFKFQKRWSYKKGTTVIVKYLPSREATPIWRQLFHCRRSDLIRGGLKYLPLREAILIWRQLFHCRRSGFIRGGVL